MRTIAEFLMRAMTGLIHCIIGHPADWPPHDGDPAPYEYRDSDGQVLYKGWDQPPRDDAGDA